MHALFFVSCRKMCISIKTLCYHNKETILLKFYYHIKSKYNSNNAKPYTCFKSKIIIDIKKATLKFETRARPFPALIQTTKEKVQLLETTNTT